MKVIGYIRVSTEGQATEGVSLEAQRSRIAKWAEANDSELIAVYEDAGISGGSMRDRVGLANALAAATKGTALVSYSISRLARSTRDMLDIAERLEKQGADLVSLSEKIDTTSAAGRMVFRMLAVLAEFESDVISERTKMALAALKAKGVKLGMTTDNPRYAQSRRALQELWANYYERDKTVKLDFCVFCGTKDGVEHHHVVPLAAGGSDEPENILSVCGKHHGLLHCVRRTPDIRALTKAGLARAKARGAKFGPKKANTTAACAATKARWIRYREARDKKCD